MSVRMKSSFGLAVVAATLFAGCTAATEVGSSEDAFTQSNAEITPSPEGDTYVRITGEAATRLYNFLTLVPMSQAGGGHGSGKIKTGEAVTCGLWPTAPEFANRCMFIVSPDGRVRPSKLDRDFSWTEASANAWVNESSAISADIFLNGKAGEAIYHALTEVPETRGAEGDGTPRRIKHGKNIDCDVTEHADRPWRFGCNVAVTSGGQAYGN